MWIFRKLNNNTGFTLVELMIAIAILGILAAIAIPAYNRYIADARCADVELATHDALAALTRARAERVVVAEATCTGGSDCNIGGETVRIPANVSITHSAQNANSLQVSGTRTAAPACPRGDGTYVVQETQTQGIW